MDRIRELSVTTMATVLILSLVASVTVLGVGIAGANHPSDAPDLTEHADFQVVLPHATDHYPGDINEEGGSIQYFASGADAFAEQDAEEGIYVDRIVVHAEYEGEDWIDYSACDTPNTEAFGIDRGNNNEGVQFDEDLVSRQKQADFRDDGIDIDFYEFSDFGGDPAYMAPEDAIVAAQGQGSSDGPCLTLTDEPGWYKIAAYMSGTVADNGPDDQPSDSAREVSLELHSNYLYVCECDSEEEAREQLGAPPDEETESGGDGGDDSTPEPTEAPSNGGDDGDSGDDSTPEPTEAPSNGGDDGDGGDDSTPEPTEAPSNGGDDGDGGTDDGSADDGGQSADDGGSGAASGEGTPTPGDGPGFTGLTAVLALLASALLAHRRH